MDSNPVVSIICLTYNQEKYVRDCLDGFISQKTEFPFEVLIYDDASTDSTPDIIREYTAKYPSIFKPTYYKENNYSRGLGFVGLHAGIKEAQGKYVAYCEGDDYWTDTDKLKKQVDFLENHPSYSVCAHETYVRDEADQQLCVLYSVLYKNKFLSHKDRSYTFSDALAGNIFHVSSMLYRNFDIALPSWISRISAFDMVWFMLLAHEGDMYVMPDVMSVYRGHIESLTNRFHEYSSAVRYYELSIKVLRLLNRYWDRTYQDRIYHLISRYYVECSLAYLHHSRRNTPLIKNYFIMAWRYNKCSAVKYFSMGFIKKAANRYGLLSSDA